MPHIILRTVTNRIFWLTAVGGFAIGSVLSATAAETAAAAAGAANAASAVGPSAAHAPEPLVLFDFSSLPQSEAIVASDAQFTVADGRLQIATGVKSRWPGVTLKAPGGKFDLRTFAEVAVRLRNLDDEPVRVSCRVDNPDADGSKNCVTQSIDLKPGEVRTLRVALAESIPEALRDKLFGMRGYPFGWREQGLQLDNITQILFFVAQPKREHRFAVERVAAEGARSAPADRSPEKLFPLIDRYGQFRHGQWPGKVHSDDELRARAEHEAADLKAHPGPSDWNRYGGWAGGPQLKATGSFRVEKVEGRWWLVDPEGRLFWSHGTDCVRFEAATPISDREFLFAELPPRDSEFGIFYGRGANAAHGYYSTRRFDTFSFAGANLMRKYGPQWRTRATDLAHQRLRSWAMNTIANWSDERIYLERKTPYTATVGVKGRSRPIEGSQGYWGKFSDPFDPAFAAAAAEAMERHRRTTADDPWCIGYFVDNELSWGDDTSLALAALASPADQPAKIAFCDQLRGKYGTIAELNAAWGTKHESWDALLKSTALPDKKKAEDDLRSFYRRTAEQYFRVCREAVKKVAPEKLYLGCRFAWTNPIAVRAACEHCDVVSFNFYRNEVPKNPLPEDCDKPIIVGEFHFGALDRGMFHTGLVPCKDQNERAERYLGYVRSAVDNPRYVGVHWFQYGDQATTGRPDGENYQIGLLDVCDTPYPETIAAVRQAGEEMYARRAGHPSQQQKQQSAQSRGQPAAAAAQAGSASAGAHEHAAAGATTDSAAALSTKAPATAGRAASGKATALFDGQTATGWTAADGKPATLAEGALQIASGRQAVVRADAIAALPGDAKAARWTFELCTRGGGCGAVVLRPAESLGCGRAPVAVVIDNRPVGDPAAGASPRTGSIVGLRHLAKSIAAGDQWFTLQLTLCGGRAAVECNGALLVDCALMDDHEGAAAVLLANHVSSLPQFAPGTLAIAPGRARQGEVLVRRVSVETGDEAAARQWFRRPPAGATPAGAGTSAHGPASQGADGAAGAAGAAHAAPAVDSALGAGTARAETGDSARPDRAVVALLRRGYLVVNYHAHLKGDLTLEGLLADQRRTGIFYGLAVNCGKGFPITDDAAAERFVASMKNQPVLLGMQAEGREWLSMFSPDQIARFDYVFTDSMTFTDHRGRRTLLWIPEEVDVPDPQAFMEMLTAVTVKILETEPIDIYVNPTFLPAVIAADYDRLWTPERIDRVIAAAVKNDVAIEINDRYRLPREPFIKRAKAAGAKFAFGVNNTDSSLGRLEYCFEMIERCGLQPDDFFTPKPAGKKKAQLRGQQPPASPQ